MCPDRDRSSTLGPSANGKNAVDSDTIPRGTNATTEPGLAFDPTSQTSGTPAKEANVYHASDEVMEPLKLTKIPANGEVARAFST